MSDRPPCIARYERTIVGSLADVWENVHDWEHLPWLHATSFRSIALLEAGEWGWRARVGLPADGGSGDAAAPEVEIALRLRPGEEAYDVTTLSGPGEGTVIATHLAAHGPEETGVSVGFHLPGVGDDAAEMVGALYVSLYTRLWDEDQSMIEGRRRVTASPPPRVPAGARADLGPREGLTLPHAFDLAGRRFQLVAHAGGLLAHDATCPHRGGTLRGEPDAQGRITCPWHGYCFDVASGRSADGRGLRLAPAPRIRIAADGRVEAVMEPAR